MSLQAVQRIANPPSADDTAYGDWVDHKDLFELLRSQRTIPSVLLYARARLKTSSVVITTALLPAAVVDELDQRDVESWDYSATETWSVDSLSGGGRPPSVRLTRPLQYIRSRNLSRGEPTVFRRTFDGRHVEKSYFEINPSLAHAHGLHWTPERHGWCRFDSAGDVETVITLDRGGAKDPTNAACVTIRRDVLDLHLAATDTVLVQFFDCICLPSDFFGWDGATDEPLSEDGATIRYRKRAVGGKASFVRGLQILRAARSSEDWGEQLTRDPSEDRKFETFLALDIKHDRIAECSTDPRMMASYFDTDSDLPLEMSPVFFNADVLIRYRSDPEKYALSDRSLSCRHAWDLQSYDVNEANQVHTYLVYLSGLPYSEQRIWRGFNEAPKAPISKRAFQTDILGQFDDVDDPLRRLRDLLDTLGDAHQPWFVLRDRSVLAELHYPRSLSKKLWGDVLTNLAKSINESLCQRFFRDEAVKAGRVVEDQWRAIKLAEEAMRGRGIDAAEIEAIVNPLRDLQNLRTKLDAHSAGDEAAAIRSQLLSDHKTPDGHITDLAARLEKALLGLQSHFDRAPPAAGR